MALRETENNAYAKFWSDQQRVLYYGMLWYFLEWSIQTLWQQVVLFQEFPYHLNVNAA